MESVDNDKIREHSIYRITILGGIVNFLLIVLKFLAGIFGKSGAMLADAVHSLSDFGTDVVVLAFVKVSNKSIDKGHDYGHGKYETLATAIIGIVLLVVGVGIFWKGACSIYDVCLGHELTSPNILAFWAAVISIVLKELVYQLTIRVGKRCDSQAVVANAWHHRSDAFSSIGTAIGIGGAILLGEKWVVLDPIAAVIVSIFIVKAALSLVKPSIDELLERSLPDEVEKEILDIILSFDYVYDPHNLRTRRIGNNIAVDVHIRMAGEMSVSQAHHITTLMEKALRDAFGQKMFIAIHVEPIK